MSQIPESITLRTQPGGLALDFYPQEQTVVYPSADYAGWLNDEAIGILRQIVPINRSWELMPDSYLCREHSVLYVYPLDVALRPVVRSYFLIPWQIWESSPIDIDLRERSVHYRQYGFVPLQLNNEYPDSRLEVTDRDTGNLVPVSFLQYFEVPEYEQLLKLQQFWDALKVNFQQPEIQE